MTTREQIAKRLLDVAASYVDAEMLVDIAWEIDVPVPPLQQLAWSWRLGRHDVLWTECFVEPA